MKRLNKALLLMTRQLAGKMKMPRLYYWSEMRLYELGAVQIMPACYYGWLYRTSMRLVEFRKLRRVANWTIHRIPYHIRFENS